MESLEGAMQQRTDPAHKGLFFIYLLLISRNVFRFPAETVEMDGEVLCNECAIKIYGNENFRTVTDAVFHPSDATFRCPAYHCEESCKSQAVSYRQFFIGSCCEPALRWLTKNENGKSSFPNSVFKTILEGKK